MNRLTLAVLFSIFFCKLMHAQDPQFTQFYANPLYLNPAFAGSEMRSRFALNYRNQWPEFRGNFITNSVSWDKQVNALHGGLGVLTFSDNAGKGMLITNNFSAIYACNIPIRKSFSLRAGVQAAFVNRRLDPSKLSFGDQVDSRYGFIYESQPVGSNTSVLNDITTTNFFDLSAGILAYNKHFKFGVAAHHLTQPDHSFISSRSRLPLKITAHSELTIPFLRGLLSDTVSSISPAALYQRQQAFQQLNVGVSIRIKSIVFGAFYRNRDAAILLLGVQRRRFAIRYSYDINISPLTNATAGAHEGSFIFQF
jgi:type IX secretion system PorP/SprF family membrane protein